MTNPYQIEPPAFREARPSDATTALRKLTRQRQRLVIGTYVRLAEHLLNLDDINPDPVLGCMRDDAELMDEIVADAYRHRSRERLTSLIGWWAAPRAIRRPAN